MLARATLHSTMSLRVTCLQWFNAELRKAQRLTAVLVGELCKAAYDLLEAAAPLTYKQQQSIRRYTDNILRGTVRLTPGEKVRLRKYKNKLRLIANRRLSIARKRREIQQTGGFLPALLAPLAATVFLPLLSQLFA